MNKVPGIFMANTGDNVISSIFLFFEEVIMKKSYLKQIILITDGCSNVGGDPSNAAAFCHERGIIVNTIGICKQGSAGAREVESIARAGGGEFQIVELQELSESVTMVTHKSTLNTIRSLVSRELEKSFGKGLQGLAPEKRDDVVKIIEKMEDDIPLKCLILLDTSGSMAEKLPAAKDSAVNLVKSLSVRKSGGLVAVVTFPGPSGQFTCLESDFTNDEKQLNTMILKPSAGGATPTAYALKDAAGLFEKESLAWEGEYVV
jgi:Ca-activated chloride channel family protein